MFLADVILGQGVRILIDTGATHNVNDINFARIMGIMERRINTTIIIGSGTKITCRSASYNVPLRVDNETFHIDALLVDTGNDVDVILSTPWLADIDNILWNFASLEIQFRRGEGTITFTSVQDRRPLQHVLALPALAPILLAPRQVVPPPRSPSPPPLPHYDMTRPTTPRQPNTLDKISSRATIFTVHLNSRLVRLNNI